MASNRLPPGKQLLGEALADDDDALCAFLVGIPEIAALNQRQPQGREEVRRYGAESRAGIVHAVLAVRAFDGKGHADAESVGVAPRHTVAGRDVFDSGYRTDPP